MNTFYARRLKVSVAFVKKWKKRLKGVDGTKLEDFRSKTTAPKKVGNKTPGWVEEKILGLRDNPPAEVNRKIGAKTIRYYLERDEEIKEKGIKVPSKSTIHGILKKKKRIAEKEEKKKKEKEELAEPMEHWQIDFKEVETATEKDSQKKAHQVEVLNGVDKGTSSVVAFEASANFTAETVLGSVAQILEEKGRPKKITFDRDPRFVGSQGSLDYPSAFRSFLYCLDIEADICPPRRPDKNAYVERYHRTYKYEAILVHQPKNLDEVIEMTTEFVDLYNYKRPHQGQACNNQPPLVAFPDLSPLAPVPQLVNPDKWLELVDGKVFKRQVNSNGQVSLGSYRYYVGQEWRGQAVLLQVEAQTAQLHLLDKKSIRKSFPLKGLHGSLMPFQDYVAFMVAQARSQHQQRLQAQVQYLPFTP